MFLVLLSNFFVNDLSKNLIYILAAIHMASMKSIIVSLKRLNYMNAFR